MSCTTTMISNSSAIKFAFLRSKTTSGRMFGFKRNENDMIRASFSVVYVNTFLLPLSKKTPQIFEIALKLAKFICWT